MNPGKDMPPGHRAVPPVRHVLAGIHEAPGHSRERGPDQARERRQGGELHALGPPDEGSVRMAHPLPRVLGAAARRARPIPISPRGDPSMASTKTKEQPSLSIIPNPPSRPPPPSPP